MASEWVKLTSQDTGKIIHANLANASIIEGLENGARIWFLVETKNGTIDVLERAEEILKRLSEVQGA